MTKWRLRGGRGGPTRRHPLVAVIVSLCVTRMVANVEGLCSGRLTVFVSRLPSENGWLIDVAGAGAVPRGDRLCKAELQLKAELTRSDFIPRVFRPCVRVATRQLERFEPEAHAVSSQHLHARAAAEYERRINSRPQHRRARRGTASALAHRIGADANIIRQLSRTHRRRSTSEWRLGFPVIPSRPSGGAVRTST